MGPDADKKLKGLQETILPAPLAQHLAVSLWLTDRAY
jgi:hypothetical protein